MAEIYSDDYFCESMPVVMPLVPFNCGPYQFFTDEELRQEVGGKTGGKTKGKTIEIEL